MSSWQVLADKLQTYMQQLTSNQSNWKDVFAVALCLSVTRFSQQLQATSSNQFPSSLRVHVLP